VVGEGERERVAGTPFWQPVDRLPGESQVKKLARAEELTITPVPVAHEAIVASLIGRDLVLEYRLTAASKESASVLDPGTVLVGGTLKEALVAVDPASVGDGNRLKREEPEIWAFAGSGRDVNEALTCRAARAGQYAIVD
jgi:hypothetical protein